MSTRVGFVSLGCPKALVDSERILTRLRGDGYEIVDAYDAADLVVVNTCGFIDAAREESLESIGEALAENGRVIVTGCLGANADAVRAAHPGVLDVTGPHQYDDVVDAVHRHLPRPVHDPRVDLIPPQGLKLTPPHYAYVKISEGCNNRCSFCIIPSMRGRLASRSVDDVMREAETLVQSGVKELLVISQDTGAYGRDIGYREATVNGTPVQSSLEGLCAALARLGVWVRLHYVYPYPHVDRIIPAMAEGRILPYLDVPLQHGSPRILKRMRRPAGAAGTLDRIRRWRAVCPDLTIRSTFIVGFPGETDEDFRLLLEFLEEAQLDRVGCFKYSPVEGAVANTLDGAVPEEVKEERWHRCMGVQQGISRERLRRRVGETLEVLVDEVAAAEIVARSSADAPEIDGTVRLPPDPSVSPGDLIRVRVEEAGDYDLRARPVEAAAVPC